MGTVAKPGYGWAATVKSGSTPRKSLLTAIAPADVPKVAIAIRVSNRRTSSSSTKTPPAIGALNAAASPALAGRQQHLTIRKGAAEDSPSRKAMPAPICTLGPSRPRARPEAIANTPPTNFIGTSQNDAGGSSLLSTASTWGIPLPAAWGENRRTSQAAIAAAVMHATTRSTKPATCDLCARPMSKSRRWSPWSNTRRKDAHQAGSSTDQQREQGKLRQTLVPSSNRPVGESPLHMTEILRLRFACISGAEMRRVPIFRQPVRAGLLVIFGRRLCPANSRNLSAGRAHCHRAQELSPIDVGVPLFLQ